MRGRAIALTLLIVVTLACSDDVARWRGRPQGRIVLDPGMTRAEARRGSTMELGRYGGSGLYFDFILASESIRFPGIAQYALTESDGRITSISFASANHSWPTVLENLRETEALLLAHGWKRHSSREVRSLPANARKLPVTDSGGIDSFQFRKGNVELTMYPYGLWGGVPWYRSARRAKRYWCSFNVSLIESDPPRARSAAR
jgi:hypothetical protein